MLRYRRTVPVPWVGQRGCRHWTTAAGIGPDRIQFLLGRVSIPTTFAATPVRPPKRALGFYPAGPLPVLSVAQSAYSENADIAMLLAHPTDAKPNPRKARSRARGRNLKPAVDRASPQPRATALNSALLM